MKKLMIAAAIVCAAAVSQAGQVNWSSTYLNVYNQSGMEADVVEGATVYLIGGNGASFFADVVAYDFATAIGNATILASATQGAMSLSNPNSASYPVTVDPFGSVLVGDGDTPAPAGLQTLFVAYNDVANNAFYISERIDGTVSAGPGSTPFTFTHDGAYAGNVFAATDGLQTAGGYYTAVPEPTSGLLLLLGMAGLALKRRRA